MPARVIARTCHDGKCPTLVETPAGDIAVQGYDLTDPATQLPVTMQDIPAGESVVVIPAETFAHLIQQYLDMRAVPA